ncbi:GNAT family N-acetyltransferase [Longibacter salinarum]|uniref:GNAT family N-acetyltransferase n=1 Tax=Longibacter salinarum TaxID=1850348 RepID=A0A2A8CUX0_9BACT|nr:GNAT family N-acetyltransferase [Longibacter salinarum]PEN12248.1 GNAT family N-acetyltransferase [Longibacter salinarum]
MSDLHIAIISTTDDDWASARAVREVVFVEEQDCPPDEEWDGYDESCRHLIGRVGDDVVATARWRAVEHQGRTMAKLERFAVLDAHRGRGYGRELVQAALDDAREAGHNAFLLHAQAHLEDFYASFGFSSTGRRFTEVGISHVEMIMEVETDPSAT